MPDMNPWTKRFFLHLILAIGTVLPVSAADEPKGSREKAGASTLEGDILDVGGKKPAAGVLVTAVHLESAKTYMAAASESGHFRLADIPHGYYELAFALATKLHIGSVPVVVGPGTKLKIDVILNDTVPLTETGEPVLVPVLDQPANAGAEVLGAYQKPFLKTKTGLATVIGSAIAALLILTN